MKKHGDMEGSLASFILTKYHYETTSKQSNCGKSHSSNNQYILGYTH